MLKDFPKWASTIPREDSRKEMPQTPDSIDQGGGLVTLWILRGQ